MNEQMLRDASALSVTILCERQQDILTFRHESDPHQEQPYTDHSVYPQCLQFALHYRFKTATQGCGQSRSTWRTTEPSLYSVMPAEVHLPESNVCVAFGKDHQNAVEQPVDNHHFTQTSAQAAHMSHDPGPVFVTLENASWTINDSFHREEAVATPFLYDVDRPEMLIHAAHTVSRNSADVADNHTQVASHSVSMQQRGDVHHQTSVSQETSRPGKPCKCSKSKCLKLYCGCFSNGVMCNSCNCINCHNNPKSEEMRRKAIQTRLMRNPNAFRPKISYGWPGEVKDCQPKGCKCKRSGCLKKYCECYEANVRCTQNCKCVGCRNEFVNVNLMDKSFSKEVPVNQMPPSVITSEVVEAVTGCLLTRAAKAEREQLCEAWAQCEILNEFGKCFTQIASTMFKK